MTQKFLAYAYRIILSRITILSDIIKKVSSRLYFLSQLKRSGVKRTELLLFSLICIRPVTEYACPVYHDSLPHYLHSDIER